MIVRGDLKPGEQIVQETLAAQLGVSRTPLRRALAALAKENFVVLSARGSAFVKRFGPEEMTSLFEIRAVLEGLACRLVAPKVHDKHLAYLRALIQDAAVTVTLEDWSVYREADIEFHTYLTTLADDAQLTATLETLQVVSLSLAQGLLRAPAETLPEHLAILDALAQRDADAAERRMIGHIRATIRHIRITSDLAQEAGLSRHG